MTTADLRKEALILSKCTRNPEWNKLRRLHLKRYPKCAVCGAIKRDNVAHHIMPVQRHPKLEMDPTNLITLCERGKFGANHHLFIGHLQNYQSYNEHVIRDAVYWRTRIKNRPK